MIIKHISGTPKAQPRPRAFARGGRASVYNPKTADEWKGQIKKRLQQYQGMNLDGNFHVKLNFFFARPKSHFGTGKNCKALKTTSPAQHTQKPDLDNLAKSVLDAITDLQIWKDDSQVTELTLAKEWADVIKPGMIAQIKLVK